MVIKALDPDPDPDPYWPPSGSTGSGSGSVKNEYGSETLIRAVRNAVKILEYADGNIQ